MKVVNRGGYVQKNVVVGICVVIALVAASYSFAGPFLREVSRSSVVLPDIYSDISPIGDIPDLNLPQSGNAQVSVFFNNENSASDCSAVFPVSRNVTSANTEATSLLELFKGPTAGEQARGFTSFFSDKTALILESLSVRNGVAAVNLADITKLIPNVSSSCGSQEFMASVESTLEQFDGIQKVLFAIEGSPQKFYNFVGLGCSADNNDCDASMFK